MFLIHGSLKYWFTTLVQLHVRLKTYFVLCYTKAKRVDMFVDKIHPQADSHLPLAKYFIRFHLSA